MAVVKWVGEEGGQGQWANKSSSHVSSHLELGRLHPIRLYTASTFHIDLPPAPYRIYHNSDAVQRDTLYCRHGNGRLLGVPAAMLQLSFQYVLL